ncbi:MAG TPA: DHHA1 domain-containing protein, partial [Bacteroidales bacterium]|nr:DHHA1 domain-containing protein [Bacteroidales bacterium]
IVDAVRKISDDHDALSKQVEQFKKDALKEAIRSLKDQAVKIGDANFISEKLPVADANMLRDAAFRLKGEMDNLFLVLGSTVNGKALLVVMISENLVDSNGLNASEIIREISRNIKGGGGGQPFFATAGGKDPEGIDAAFRQAREIMQKQADS